MSLSKTIKRRRQKELVVTPVIDQWLVEVGDIVLDADQAQTIAALFQKQPRDRSGSFAGSARGQCLRSQVFDYIGAPGLKRMDSTLQNLFNDGTWRHLRWQAMGLSAGLFKQVEVPLHAQSIRLRGSMDAIGEDFAFELKGIRSVSFIKDGPYHSHLLQVHSYMLMCKELNIDIGNRVVLLYEDKASQDWREFVVYEDPAIAAEVWTEIQSLNDAVDTKTLPPVKEECRNGTGTTFNSCAYREICLGCTYDKAEAAAAAAKPESVSDREASRPKRVAKRNR